VELRRRLKIDLQLVDSRFAVLLPHAAGVPVPTLLTLLDSGNPDLRAALAASIQSRGPQSVTVDGLQIVCVALTTERRVSGVLLLGRVSGPGQDAETSRAQLELIGSWLSTAVEAHLVGPPSMQASGVDRVAALARLFSQAADRTSDRELVRLFGEAVAVWHDIEVCGYVDTAAGTFIREVALPGARKGERPAVLPAAGLPESIELTQLPQGHLDRFGLPVSSDAYVTRLRRGSGRSWLLVVTGAIDAYDLQRLSAYVALLDVALALASATAAARAVSAVNRQLFERHDAPDRVAGRALDVLRSALGAGSAAVSIEPAEGAPLVRVVRPDPRADAAAARTTRLVVLRRTERHCTTTLGFTRSDGRQFTPRDYDLANAAVDVFDTWGRAAMSRPVRGRDRRAAAKEFPEVIERFASAALDRGSAITTVALVAQNAAFQPGLTQRWVAGMRGHVRASDLAGMIAEGEIALLLHDTSAEDAARVAGRLRAAVGGTPGADSMLIGVASRAPGTGSAVGVVQQARADALRAGDGVRASVVSEVRS
jgi:hypothetical protein